MKPMRANIVGPSFSATGNSASMARLQTVRTGGIGGRYRRSRNADKRVRRAIAPLYVGESGFLIVKMSVGRTDLAMA
jgi:hypothetical protein